MTNLFKLSDNFIEQYKTKKPDFGFNGLGELVYYRTYSRVTEDGKNENWWETCKRVVEGTYNMQKEHIEQYSLGWNAIKAQRSAQEMYDRIFTMKFLPPGRGLWAMGTPIITERNIYAALNNCSFVSTSTLKEDLSKPFCFLMDMSMLGVGVGFDVKGAGQLMIKTPNYKNVILYSIPDSREGWVESVKLLLESYFLGHYTVDFDYSQIRKSGLPIRGFGGISSGPQALLELHTNLKLILNNNIDKYISITVITDIMNLIGKCVIAGNVRRTAEAVLGDAESEEYINLKNYNKNPERESFGWVSNNSIFGILGMDYTNVAKRIKDNGEPGIIWLDNVRNYSRMVSDPDYKDLRVAGVNPCFEQSLESYECCCLVEIFPFKHTSLEDFKKTLKYAYLYGKTVTLGKSHWPETNRVMLRNRRIGCSLSGIQQFIGKNGLETFREWCEVGYKTIQDYDTIYSEWFAIPKSLKVTSIKPSGTVSLLAGATPGIHWPESRFYIRRIRLSNKSPLLAPLKIANYKIEPAFGSEDTTVVVEVPIDVGKNIKNLNNVSMWEQLNMAAFMQKYWSDNQVSCTITFDPDKEGDSIVDALQYFQYQLKAISFLPRHKGGAYKQMPYEEITEETYNHMLNQIIPLDFATILNSELEVEKFCTNDSCSI